MANENSKGTSMILAVLRIAMGAMLAAGGILTLQKSGGLSAFLDKGDLAVEAIRSFIKSGDTAGIIVSVFAVIELVCGIFLIIEAFAGNRFGPAGAIAPLIVAAVWAVAIVLVDFMGKKGLLNGGANDLLQWLHRFSSHLVLLSALLIIK